MSDALSDISKVERNRKIYSQSELDDAVERAHKEGAKAEREKTLVILKEIRQYVSTPIGCGVMTPIDPSIDGCQYLSNIHALRIHQIVNEYELESLRHGQVRSP